MDTDTEAKLIEALATGLAIADGCDAFGIGPDTPDRQDQRDWFRRAAREQLAAHAGAVLQAASAPELDRWTVNREIVTIVSRNWPVGEDTHYTVERIDMIKELRAHFDETVEKAHASARTANALLGVALEKAISLNRELNNLKADRAEAGADQEIVWQYGRVDHQEPNGIMQIDGTPRGLWSPNMRRRPLHPAGPWALMPEGEQD